MTEHAHAAAVTLPRDGTAGTLVGRVWDPAVGGPSVVAIREGGIIDLSATFATMRDLAEHPNPAAAVAAAVGPMLGSIPSVIANTPEAVRDTEKPWLLSPIDLQVVKAAGVTFPVSMLERIIEERAHGDAAAAHGLRQSILDQLGGELRNLVPGSPEASRLKQYLVAEGLWSQYLEVGIGPDAEVFTKAPVLSTVGTSVDVGIRSDSEWNNPEPEVVLLVNSRGEILGATLGNDVNLRDIEGRSALLLGQAKDNNASASVGPFVRLFDATFDLDALRAEIVKLRIVGRDGYILEATSPMSEISRDPADLVAQVVGRHHQYPDGFVLFLGTMFAPSDDRSEPGRGFTHKIGDLVTISSPLLGSLVNRVVYSDDAAPWAFGIADLMTNLASRGVLSQAELS